METRLLCHDKIPRVIYDCEKYMSNAKARVDGQPDSDRVHHERDRGAYLTRLPPRAGLPYGGAPHLTGMPPPGQSGSLARGTISAVTWPTT